MHSRVVHPVVALICCLTLTPFANAHSLCLKAEKRQGRLYVEAWYDNDVPADGAVIKVFQAGRAVAEGKTDERGVWAADCPVAGRYTIEANDGGAHRASVEFTIVASADEQHAGTSHEEVAQRRFTGTVLGLGVLVLLILAGRWWLRARPASTAGQA